jgi:hypothetical protein
MGQSRMKTPGCASCRASALVLVLGAITIISGLVVALVMASKLERLSAFHYVERSRAYFLAQEAVATAQMMLDAAYAQTNAQVVTMPGRIMVRLPGRLEWVGLDLSSGPSPVADAKLSVDLNRVVLSGDRLPLINPMGGEMRVAWTYVQQDGARVSGAPPAYTASNPVVGRYAFWVDDESSRVNLNTANRRQNNGTVPAQVDLTALSTNLPPELADRIRGSSSGRPFQSVQEPSQLGEQIAGFVSSNRFALTHYNRASYRNPWGEPKIFLTTQATNLPPELRNLPENERAKYFLDVLNSPEADPARNSSLNFAKLTRVLNRLNVLFERRDWPLVPGQNFSSKFKPYADQGSRRATQLALDIIQYVRSAETAEPVVSLIRGRWSGTNFVAATTQDDLFVSVGRSPLITEVALWVSPTRVGGGGEPYEAQLRFELFLPPHYGVSSVDLTTLQILLQTTGKTVLTSLPISAGMARPSVIEAGGYAVVTTPVFPLRGPPSGADPGYVVSEADLARLYLRVVLLNMSGEFLEQAASGNRIDITDASGLEYPIVRPAAEDVPLEQMPSFQVDDPRANKNKTAWVRRTGSTFGAPNSNWKMSQPAADGLPQDLDGTAYSDFSMAMPAPKGDEDNHLGRVTSVAELGRIPTGIETAATHRDKAVPWRTLRLQPTSKDDQTIPDWMLLDLFAAPVVPDLPREPVLFSDAHQISGEVNVNTAVAPFEGLAREGALAALFGDDQHPAIPNIRQGTRAARGRVFGGSAFYSSVAELAEIKGMADTGEKGEANLRLIASQSTVQGQTFRVFAIGESVSQAPSGDITAGAAKTVEALMGLDPEIEPPRFRPITWQNHSL